MTEAPTQSDRALVAHQLQALALLDEAHRSVARTGAIAGLAFLLLGLSCPGTALLGKVLEQFVSAGFVHRMANIPIWVMAIMVVCSGFLATVGFVFGWRQRHAGSPVLAHLRASPDDPIVASGCQVYVRDGHRSAYFTFVTRGGRTLEQVVNASFEERVATALAAAIPPA